MADSLAHRGTVSAINSAAGNPGAAVAQSQTDSIPVPVVDSTHLTASDTITTDPNFIPFPHAAFGTADSLRIIAGPAIWHDTTAIAVFGAESVTVEPTRILPAPSSSLTDNAVFQSFVLLLAATYAMLLYRNLGDVRTLLSRISRETASGKRLSEDSGSNEFSRFLHIATAIGILFMGVVTVKYGDSLMPGSLREMLPYGAVLALSLLTTFVWCGLGIYQKTSVWLIGAVTVSQPFTRQLALIKRIYFAFLVIITSPALLLFALCPHGTGGVWFCIVAIELTITAILYLRETLNLFLSKKVSILHWFLYLCTVEIFPISLLWLLAIR